MLEEQHTSYGVKMVGSSRFVFVAPHAGGDDKKTGLISRHLARILNGSYIVNQHYFKPINSKATHNPENISDFNRLEWSHKQQKYIWIRKHPELKKFYDDIADLCDNAIVHSKERAVAIHVHGMHKNDSSIDLGVGLRENNDGVLTSNTEGHIYTGVETLPQSKLRLLQKHLDNNIPDPHNGVTIGMHYPAFSKRMGIQFHRHNRDDWSVQIEIDKSLKQTEEDAERISKIIAQSLEDTFK